MESRTWLAIILCFFVWFAWMKWFAPPPQVPQESAPIESKALPQGEAPSVPASKMPSATQGVFSHSLKTAPSIKLSNGKLEVTLSELGARVSRIQILGYQETMDKDSSFIETIDPLSSNFSLATLFSDASLKNLADSPYQVKESTTERVVFNKEIAGGIVINKEYVLAQGAHAFESKLQLSFPKGSKRDWGQLLLPIGKAELQHDANTPLKSWEVVAYQNDSLTRKHIEQLKPEETVLQGSTAWLAFGNRYFSTAVVNESSLNPDVVMVNDKVFAGGYLRYPLQLKETQKTIEFNWRIYSGPKDLNELSKYKGLRQLVDYGMFSFLAYPLVQLLKFFYGFVHNYGVAIILLTVLVRLLFYPLSLQGYRSMKNMQKLQPQVAALKEKYKDDKEKLNREQLALFKAHKVNPAGGCLPMLVQLPVFIALYAVLQNSIDLFHSPFFGWINDLSVKDPYYIYPVLMGIAMLLQQRLTPTVGMDPTQAKMMYIMPIFFTFLMVNLPSGLTLYIFVSTLLGIVQQLSMTKDRQTAPLAPLPAGGAESAKKA